MHDGADQSMAIGCKYPTNKGTELLHSAACDGVGVCYCNSCCYSEIRILNPYIGYTDKAKPVDISRIFH